jgi:hypothetical protein
MILVKKFITTKFLDIESREGIKQNYFNRNQFQRFTLTVCRTAFKYIPFFLTCTPMLRSTKLRWWFSKLIFIYIEQHQISFTERRSDLLRNNTNNVATKALRREEYYKNTEIKRECTCCLKQVGELSKSRWWMNWRTCNWRKCGRELIRPP